MLDEAACDEVRSEVRHGDVGYGSARRVRVRHDKVRSEVSHGRSGSVLVGQGEAL